MPANLGIDKSPIIGDPRFRVGSYIEDGEHLYVVTGRKLVPRRGLVAPHETLACENCKTGYPVGVEMLEVRRHWRLVRALPVIAPLPGGFAAPDPR